MTNTKSELSTGPISPSVADLSKVSPPGLIELLARNSAEPLGGKPRNLSVCPVEASVLVL